MTKHACNSETDIKRLARLWIIIPCYNEEVVLPQTAPMFLKKLKSLITDNKNDDSSRILFVNDGSTDRTWDLITAFARADTHYTGIAQSRNRGHQNALVAGMMEAIGHCDMVVTIDCDGQDDVNAMDEMIAAYYDGCDVVYGVRSDRTTDTWFKRTTAQAYYRILNRMGIQIVYNHADYRLVSEKVLRCFADYKEVNLFLRGIFPLIGFKSTSVYYKRNERIAGESHYPLRKMIALAVDGITSLSMYPLTMIFKFGVGVTLIGFVALIILLVSTLCGNSIPGWLYVIFTIVFMGGLQFICLGVVGEYTGKTYMESKHRPRFIISGRTWDVDKDKNDHAGDDLEENNKNCEDDNSR